jgi:hypothetical protein
MLGAALGFLPAVGAHAQVFDNSNVGYGDDSGTYAYNINLSAPDDPPQAGLGYETQVSDNDPGAAISGSATATDNIGNATSETVQSQASGVPTGYTASSNVSSTLSTGTVSIQLAGTGNGTVGAVAGGYAQDSDLLTFNIPGATPSTVTQIPLTFTISSSGAAGNGYGSGTAYLTIDGGNATFLQGATYTGLNPGDTVSGFSSESLTDTGPGSAIFTADYAVTGASPQVNFGFYANGGAGLGASFNLADSLGFNLPAGITFTSQSGVFDTQVPEPTVVALLASVTSAALLRRRRRGAGA